MVGLGVLFPNTRSMGCGIAPADAVAVLDSEQAKKEAYAVLVSSSDDDHAANNNGHHQVIARPTMITTKQSQ
jgi:hypothetical protein